MLRIAVVVLLFSTISAKLSAHDKPRSVHIQGPQALHLISLLVSGSSPIESSFMAHGGTRILLHDLEAMKLSTYKYNRNSAMYRLDVYSAHAQIGDADSTPLGEATALYALLSALGVTPDGSMQGASVEADTVDCRINTHVPYNKPQRFVCDLALPF